MPSFIKVRILGGRDLPVMDTRSELTDAYVIVKFAECPSHRTNIAPKTLNPVWNEECRFEVADDRVLQDDPLEIEVWDFDVISTDDIIGNVLIDLNPLLRDGVSQIAGWIPIFDTLKGTRGELNVVVKLDFFNDVNPFKDTSAGISFFTTRSIPYGYSIIHMHGFVEELVVEDDPEYHWYDKIRSHRQSNEARQMLLYEISGKLRRLLGRQVQDNGCNAVIGFNHTFDFESDSGVLLARATGTAVTLVREQVFSPGLSASPTSATIPSMSPTMSPRRHSNPAGLLSRDFSPGDSGSAPNNMSQKDLLGGQRKEKKHKAPMEGVQLLTISSFPAGKILRIGGVVSAKSIKLLTSTRRDRIQEARDSWWNELREEIRSHARALGCSYVIAYRESISINQDSCLLSAAGTAVRMESFRAGGDLPAHPSILPQRSFPVGEDEKRNLRKPSARSKGSCCAPFHAPYRRRSAPFPMRVVKCGVCKEKYVPEILLATCEIPEGIFVSGPGHYVEARVCRPKKRVQGEQGAIYLSEAVPFLEYDLHKVLVHKLRVRGLNAAFGLRSNICVGESMIVGTISVTGIYADALPTPLPFRVQRNITTVDEEDIGLVEIQLTLEQQSIDNCAEVKAMYEKKAGHYPPQLPRGFRRRNSSCSSMSSVSAGSDSESDSSESEKENPEEAGAVVEIDDDVDEDIMAVILEPERPSNINMCNTSTLPGVNVSDGVALQLFTAMRRFPFSSSGKGRHINQKLCVLFEEMYGSIIFKMKHFFPCTLTGLNMQVQLPGDCLELLVTGLVVSTVPCEDPGVVLSGKSPMPPPVTVTGVPAQRTHDQQPKSTGEMLADDFRLEEPATPGTSRIPLSLSLEGINEALGESGHISKIIELSPLSYVPGARIERSLGPLFIYHIKESWTIRDEGGLGGFAHTFLSQVLAITRANVQSRGGNAMIGFEISHCRIEDKNYKTQAYSMICVQGDVVEVTYTDTTESHTKHRWQGFLGFDGHMD